MCIKSLILLFFLAVLGLHCWEGFSLVAVQGLSLQWLLIAEDGLSGTQAPLVAAHGLSTCGSWALQHRLSSCGKQT